ncbi:hypothetical protein HPP92_000228 [Vanilla planifolia]|nr:hypothetical protein HPP92_000228 [Vanilla planifolia]
MNLVTPSPSALPLKIPAMDDHHRDVQHLQGTALMAVILLVGCPRSCRHLF